MTVTSEVTVTSTVGAAVGATATGAAQAVIVKTNKIRKSGTFIVSSSINLNLWRNHLRETLKVFFANENDYLTAVLCNLWLWFTGKNL